MTFIRALIGANRRLKPTISDGPLARRDREYRRGDCIAIRLQSGKAASRRKHASLPRAPPTPAWHADDGESQSTIVLIVGSSNEFRFIRGAVAKSEFVGGVLGVRSSCGADRDERRRRRRFHRGNQRASGEPSRTQHADRNICQTRRLMSSTGARVRARNVRDSSASQRSTGSPLPRKRFSRSCP